MRKIIVRHVVGSRSDIQLMLVGLGVTRMRYVTASRRRCWFCIVADGCRMVILN